MCDQCFWNDADRFGLFLSPLLKIQLLNIIAIVKPATSFLLISILMTFGMDGWNSVLHGYIQI